MRNHGLVVVCAWSTALAVMLATAPIDELRDGKRALSEAERACELAEYKQWLPLCSLRRPTPNLADSTRH